MSTVNRRWYSGMASSEDWWAVWLGMILFLAGFMSIAGVDLVGWMAKTRTWVDFSPDNVLQPAGAAYAGWGPWASLGMTYAVFTILTCAGAAAMRLDVRRFFLGWTILFAITWLTWIIGHEAHLKATPNDFDKYGIEWGLSLGGGASYLLALVVGLAIGNFVKPLARFLEEAAKPEWYIKTAIVFLGIKIGLMSMEAAGFAFELAMAGICAAFAAYLLFWPIMYAAGRRLFSLPRQWAAVLASGISICGVSAAIATAGAIRAKPVIPVMVSMLIVVFAMVELIILPGVYAAFAPNEPIVNGAALGLTIKTDGADAAAGAILDELMRATEAGQGWQEGWILAAAVMTKIWIDVFIGVWAFVLALIWIYKVERSPGQLSIGLSEIWFRFPKFVLGYLLTWFVYLGIATFIPDLIEAAKTGAETVQSPMRKMMFMLTFVSIGVITDFSKLRGMKRLALLYGGGLLFIIVPLGYFIAWVFHRGMLPPTTG
ncbi:MAG: putative sulfate exporter family transporter [Gammaproteobacteria bacterium]